MPAMKQSDQRYFYLQPLKRERVYLLYTLASHDSVAKRVEVNEVLALPAERHKDVLRGWVRRPIRHHSNQLVHVAEQPVVDLCQVKGGVTLGPLGFPHAHFVRAHLDQANHHCLSLRQLATGTPFYDLKAEN